MPLLILLATAALIVGAVCWGIHHNEKIRREQFEAVAEEMSLEFHPQGDPAVESALGELHLFNLGRKRKSVNMLCGKTEDVELAVFGYWFVTGSGDSRKTRKQSVVSFRSPNLSLPKFELRPEGLFHKIGQAFGSEDIDFESNPEFSKRYLLRGDDEPAVRAIFTPQLLSHLEAQQKISIEGSGDTLVFYRAHKRIDPADIQPFIEEGFRIYGLLKQVSSA